MNLESFSAAEIWGMQKCMRRVQNGEKTGQNDEKIIISWPLFEFHKFCNFSKFHKNVENRSFGFKTEASVFAFFRFFSIFNIFVEFQKIIMK